MSTLDIRKSKEEVDNVVFADKKINGQYLIAVVKPHNNQCITLEGDGNADVYVAKKDLDNFIKALQYAKEHF